MGGLTLTLRPREKFLVGGNLVENGPRRSSITITNDSVYVLRLTDAIHPNEVTTPVRRAYHAAQQILACEVVPEVGQPVLLEFIKGLAIVFQGTEHIQKVQRAQECAEDGRYHGVLIGLKALLPVEDALLEQADVSSRDTTPVAVGYR